MSRPAIGKRRSHSFDQTIAHSANGKNMLRIRGIFLKMLAQAHDEIVNGSIGGIFTLSPGPVEYLVAAYGLTIALGQQLEYQGLAT